MSSTSLNDLFQWITIGALALLTLAIYRHVGMVSLGSRDYYLEVVGPPVGETAPSALLSVFEGGLKAWNLIVFVVEDCMTCEALVNQLREPGRIMSRDDVQLAVLYRGPEQFGTSLSSDLPGAIVAAANEVLGPEELLEGVAIPGFPFSFVLSDSGKVVAKHVGTGAEPLFEVLNADLDEPGRLMEEAGADGSRN